MNNGSFTLKAYVKDRSRPALRSVGDNTRGDDEHKAKFEEWN